MSGKQIILLLGGLFLIWKSVKEIQEYFQICRQNKKCCEKGNLPSCLKGIANVVNYSAIRGTIGNSAHGERSLCSS
jgi:hypothetical protein